MTIEKLKEKIDRIEQRIKRQEKKMKNNIIRKVRSKRKRRKSYIQNYSIGINMILKNDYNRKIVQRIIAMEKKLQKDLDSIKKDS